METIEIQGIIGLFVSFFIMLSIAGWLIYSFYIKPEREKRRHLP